MLACANLCGGLATRLRPVTEDVPKSMISIAGRPFVAHQLDLLRSRGVAQVVLCTGHLGDQIRAYVGDGSRFDLDVLYSPDGDQPLGTAGAIRKALPLLGESFFVLYGDSYLPCDMRAVAGAFHAARLPALMTVYKNSGKYDSSNVVLRDGRVSCYDKESRSPEMCYID